MITGVPDYVDGRMLDIAGAAGARLVNRDRMWHYVEGVRNWAPIWPDHAIRILPGPSPLWFDALGRRLPFPALPGYDTIATLKHLRTTPDLIEHDHSWFIVTETMLAKEFALSGSEQNQDLTGKEVAGVVRKRSLADVTPSMQAFLDKGADFVQADTVEDLVAKMNDLLEDGEPLLDAEHVKRQIDERDGQLDNPYAKDAQIAAMRVAR